MMGHSPWTMTKRRQRETVPHRSRCAQKRGSLHSKAWPSLKSDTSCLLKIILWKYHWNRRQRSAEAGSGRSRRAVKSRQPGRRAGHALGAKIQEGKKQAARRGATSALPLPKFSQSPKRGSDNAGGHRAVPAGPRARRCCRCRYSLRANRTLSRVRPSSMSAMALRSTYSPSSS